MCCGLLQLAACGASLADNKPIQPTHTVRVDTSQANINACREVITAYLNSHPDSLYDNPWWSALEKARYAEPYSARAWVYPSHEILQAFPPRILSIEREGPYYCIRLLYYAENLDSLYSASNPWAVQRLYLGLESNALKLFDPLRVITAAWSRTTIGKVEFVYPPTHVFDRDLATQTANLVDSLAAEMGRPLDFTIEFYIEHSLDGLGAMAGLDFTLNVSAGRAIVPNHTVLTSTGLEWYPHEIVHVVLNSDRTHYLLSEGIATLIGGTGDRSFAELVKELQLVWEADEFLKLEDFLAHPYQAGSFTHFYALGAVLCKAALERGGTPALRHLLFAGAADEDFFRSVETVFQIRREDLTSFIREKTRAFASED